MSTRFDRVERALYWCFMCAVSLWLLTMHNEVLRAIGKLTLGALFLLLVMVMYVRWKKL